MSISFGGIQSGLNTDKIINQLLRIEAQPQQRFQSQIEDTEEKQQAFQDLNSRVESLLGNIDTLAQESTFQQKAISNNKPDVLSAEIVDQDKVQNGTFDIFVESLATNASVTSGQQIQNQTMVDSSKNATSISDFEVAEGSDTIDLTGTSSTSEMLDQLSKEVNTGSGDEIRIDFNGDGTFDAGETFDLDNHDNFQSLIDTINQSAANDDSGGTINGQDIDGDGTEEFLQFGYDSTKDKFFLQSLDQGGATNPGGNTFRLDDNQSVNDANFFQAIGINNDETIHEFSDQQSATGENLISLDPSKQLQNNLFTTPVDFSSGTAGEVTVRVNSTELTLQDTDTVNDFISKVNDKVDGVNASYNSATDKIKLKTENTGAGSIDVEDVEGNLADVLNLRTENAASGGQVDAVEDDGTDAEVKIDGDTVTAEGNTVTFNGIQLDLKDLHTESNNTDDPVRLEVGKDTEGITKDVQNFVQQFNSIMEFINTRNNTNPASEPGEEAGESGVFANDSTIRRIKNRLVETVTQRFEQATGSDVIQDAGSVGIEQRDPLTVSDKNQGKLNFDSGAFQEALNEAPNDVEKLFTADTADGDAADGMATQLSDYVENGLTDELDGILPSRIDGFDRTIQDLNERIEENQERVQQRREQLEQKFLQMERTLTQLNSQQQFVSARL